MANRHGRPGSKRDRSGRFAPEMTAEERELYEWVKWGERSARELSRTLAAVNRRIPRYERQLARGRAKLAAKQADADEPLASAPADADQQPPSQPTSSSMPL